MNLQSNDSRYVFNRNRKEPTISLLTANNEDYEFRKYIKDSISTPAKLSVYEGRYFCPELNCFYNIELKKGQLYLVNDKYADIPVGFIGRDHLSTPNWWMSHLVILRNDKNAITGFEVNTGRVMHLYFNKVE
jgi:hypothetical protein